MSRFNPYALKSMQLVVIALSFVKLLFFLRIIKRLSFIIQMLLEALLDIFYILIFAGIIVIFFSISIAVLIKDDLSKYDKIGPLGYFIIAVRQSVGDFDTSDSLIASSKEKILVWILYMTILIVGNVVFMNFIIAVVNQSYSDNIQKMTAEANHYKFKLQIIREREALMTSNDINNKEWFPNFIILCKPII